MLATFPNVLIRRGIQRRDQADCTSEGFRRREKYDRFNENGVETMSDYSRFPRESLTASELAMQELERQ